LSALISRDFDLVGAVLNGPAVLKQAEGLHLDAIVMDISMPGMTGIEAARQLRERGNRTPIVFVSDYVDDEILQAAFDAGGTAYVSKPLASEELVSALQTVIAGGTYVSASLDGDQDPQASTSK
jgi:DNA-binding NarL/FixJ family response regulator